MVSFQSKPKKIFVSYCHQDAKWLKRLQVHLKPLEREEAIDLWADTRIKPGSKWREEIKDAIGSAKVAILLISADFLASDFINQNELPPLLAAAERKDTVILPVIISPSRYKYSIALSQFQAVNDLSKPLVDLSEGEQETLFADIAEYIRQALEVKLVCPVCSAILETATVPCFECSAVYRPARLGQLYGLSHENLRAYLKIYQARAVKISASSDDLLPAALICVMLSLFDNALDFIVRILNLTPTHAYAWYLKALIKLRGKRPAVLTRTEALKVESYLQNALTYDKSQSHTAFLLALIKDDFFRRKGFRISEPSIEKCIELANSGEKSKEENRVLLQIVPVPNGKITDIIRNIT